MNRRSQVVTIVTLGPCSPGSRKPIAQKHNGTASADQAATGIGRTPALAVRMAEETGIWGLSATSGCVVEPGHKLARGTIAEILQRRDRAGAKREDALEEFLTRHWEVIVTAGSFTLEA
jgi:hypothetical protein